MTERTSLLSYLLRDCKNDCEDGHSAGRGASYYDAPFQNPKLSASLTASLREAARKRQLFEQAGLNLSAQRQAQRLSGLLAYVGKNHIPAARAGALA